MNVLDIGIVVAFALSAILGFRGGVIRTAFSVAGLVIGIAFASGNYERFAGELAPMVHSLATAETIWFLLLIALAMVASSMLGHQVQAAVDWHGLGAFDRVLGLTLGALRGAAVAGLLVMMGAAFFPQSDSFLQSQLTPRLLHPTELLTVLTSSALKQRVNEGLSALPVADSAPSE